MTTEYQIPNHVKGDTWEGLTLNVRDSQGASLDPLFASARMQVKASYDSDAVVDLTSGAGEITVSGTETDIVIEPTVVDIAAGTYVYDIEVTDLDGTKKTYLRGRWKILEGVTEA